MRTGREATGEVSLLPAADIMYYCTLNQYWMMLGSDQCLTIDHHYHLYTIDRLVSTYNTMTCKSVALVVIVVVRVK